MAGQTAKLRLTLTASRLDAEFPINSPKYVNAEGREGLYKFCDAAPSPVFIAS